MSWYKVTHISNIPLREGRKVRLPNRRELALFNLGTHFLAIDQQCPHLGGPLSDGIVVGDTVVCPLHAWKICLSTGSVRKPASNSCVRSYPTRIENETVFIEFTEEIPEQVAS